mgnify:CR=1 FL=1|tara:strand:- start:1147 stop:1773 length:627 start_codon:yes stop_codon:yes gene_type:complete
MSKLETYNLSAGQLEAIELVALSPTTSNKDLAKTLKVSESTISAWRKNPVFIEACYDRFVEINGTRLMKVLDSMFSEAESGSVPAAQLILNHYNKLNNKIELTVDSPFEKFLKNQNMIEADYQEVDSEKIEKELITNNKEYKVQKKRLNSVIVETKKQKKNRDQNLRYELRKRAKIAGIDPLPAGRQPDHVRKAWLKKLQVKEKELGL